MYTFLFGMYMNVLYAHKLNMNEQEVIMFNRVSLGHHKNLFGGFVTSFVPVAI